MSKYTRHHYIFAQLLSILRKNIDHSRYLVDTYPKDPRTDFECSMLNVYEKFYNFITGSDDTTVLNEDWDVMVRVVKESKGLQKTKPTKVEPEQSVVIAQTQMSSAPELVAEDELHKVNMEEIPAVPKKTKKVKTN